MSDAPQCTWKGCELVGINPKLDGYGNTWAHLCDSHDHELDQGVASGRPNQLLRAWVLAQGGAGVATNRMLGK